MNDLSDTIHESVELAKESKLNSYIAVTVAISATFMAVCNIKDGNIVQGMSQAQAHTVNSWSYFEAKSTKQMITENTLLLLQTNNSGATQTIKNLEAKIARYQVEKEEIKNKAVAFEQEYNDLNVFDDQFDMTDAFLSIAIALFGITALTQKKWLFYFAAGLSSAGLFFGITAFLQVPVHFGWISKVLG